MFIGKVTLGRQLPIGPQSREAQSRQGMAGTEGPAHPFGLLTGMEEVTLVLCRPAFPFDLATGHFYDERRLRLSRN